LSRRRSRCLARVLDRKSVSKKLFSPPRVFARHTFFSLTGSLLRAGEPDAGKTVSPTRRFTPIGHDPIQLVIHSGGCAAIDWKTPARGFAGLS
jgi:hypothetical protein